MGATADDNDPWGDPSSGPERSSRARRVVEVRVHVVDGSAVLLVRSIGRRGMHVRELRAPATTAEHAASAVARHYGLVRTAGNCWQAVRDPEPTAPPAVG
jgi:hypothetical protein